MLESLQTAAFEPRDRVFILDFSFLRVNEFLLVFLKKSETSDYDDVDDSQRCELLGLVNQKRDCKRHKDEEGVTGACDDNG